MVVEQVTTVSNSNASYFKVVLSRVELRWVLTKVLKFHSVTTTFKFIFNINVITI